MLNITWIDFEQWHNARMSAFDDLKRMKAKKDKTGINQYTTMLAEVDAAGRAQFPNRFDANGGITHN